MQSSILPAFPVLYASFKYNRDRFDSGAQSPALDLTKIPAPPSWAYLPSPPMSGSPTQEERPEIPQLAGQRRKRSDSPSTTAAALVSSAPRVPLGQGLTPFQSSSQALTSTIPGQALGGRYSISQQPYYGSSLPSVENITRTGEGRPYPGLVSPKAARKAKAHVASACINCKKKHLRCDAARPCRRCEQSGKESTCVDVEHKKRGRPSLKADEPSRRAFEGAVSQLTNPDRRLSSASVPRYPQSGVDFMRSIRSGHQDSARPSFRPTTSHQTIYPAPTVSQSPATAMGIMATSRHSYTRDTPPGAVQSLNQYHRASGGYAVGSLVPEQPTSQMYWGSYGGMTQAAPAQHYVPSTQGPSYAYPPFARTSAGEFMASEPTPNMYASTLQLPPIRPAPGSTATEPTLAQQQRYTGFPTQYNPEPSPINGSSEQPDPKRPRMDIKGILD